MTPTSWPDLNRAYISHLTGEHDINAAWRTPHDLEFRTPFVEVPPPTGGDDGLYFQALMDFECYASSYGESVMLGNRIRDLILDTHNSIVGGVQIGRVETATGPQYVHYSAQVFRVIYSARITVLPQ